MKNYLYAIITGRGDGGYSISLDRLADSVELYLRRAPQDTRLALRLWTFQTETAPLWGD